MSNSESLPPAYCDVDQPPPPAYCEVELTNGESSKPSQCAVVPIQQISSVYQPQPGGILSDGCQNDITMQIQGSQPIQSCGEAVELKVAQSANGFERYLNPDSDHSFVNGDKLPKHSQNEMNDEQNKSSSYHCKAWFLTFWLTFFLISYVICYSVGPDQYCSCWNCQNAYLSDDSCSEIPMSTCSDLYSLECDFPCSMTYALGFGFWGIFLGVYLLYWGEICCCSSSFRYLKNINNEETAIEYIDRLRQCVPKIIWNIKCWHTETRTRTVTDENGNSRTETYQVDVTTWTAEKTYEYNSWKDVSTPISNLNYENNMIRLHCYKTFTFANEETRKDYNFNAAVFRSENDRDKHQIFTYRVEFPNFKEKVLIKTQPGQSTSTIISPKCFLWSSLIGCTTCFRMYFASVCPEKHLIFQKEISI